jgi:hypothetical protein
MFSPNQCWFSQYSGFHPTNLPFELGPFVFYSTYVEGNAEKVFDFLLQKSE